MSVANQANGKKSSNSSSTNTPASTPVGTNGGVPTVIHNSPPPNNNAPKYGTLVPNRIFVGGISANTTEGELLQLFSTYGTVKAAKIIQDRAGVSKGYGFITFESEDDAQRPLREADNIVLRERKLNIAPAVKKQLSFPQPFNFNRAFDGASPNTVPVGNPQFFIPQSMPYFQGSVSYYPTPTAPVPGDPNGQPPVYPPSTVYPAQTGPPQAAPFPQMMFPAQTIYMPQQYPMAVPYDYYIANNGAPTQFVVGAQGGPGPQGPPLPPSGSPPRPPCYNQQVAYGSEPLYYNMYPGSIDHGQVYAEALEAAGGNYTEQQEPYMGQLVQDVVDPRFHTRSAPLSENAVACAPSEPPNLVHHHNAPPHHVNAVSAGAPRYNNNNNRITSSCAEQQQQQQEGYESDTTVRKTQTPVVSLLSIDNSVEKDLNAMQGGRKKKPALVPHAVPQAGGVYGHAPVLNGLPPQMTFHYPPPALNYHPQGHFNYPSFQNHQQQQHPFNSAPPPRYAPQTNGYPRRPQQKRNNHNNNRNNGTWIVRPSSVRTESGSSTTSILENGHDEKPQQQRHQRTNVTTPPPAPYSPLTNHGYAPRYNGVPSPPNGQFNPPNNQYSNRNNYRNQDNSRKFFGKSNKNNGHFRTNNVKKSNEDLTNNRGDVNNRVTLMHDVNAQVHSGGGSAGFAPRRNNNNGRRSMRRSQMGAALSEIGAGDAPLPAQNSDSASEACKKMADLKL